MTPATPAVVELQASSGTATLAGSLWLPSAPPPWTVVMHPGSGPSDRDNDVYFPPIRTHLLAGGMAVASFDKRGVGASTGRLLDADIETQADDAIAAVRAVRAAVPAPVALFGHSQGGWVVLEAGSRREPGIELLITNAGPGVTPGEQERYSIRCRLEADGRSAADIAHVLDRLEGLFEALRADVRPATPDPILADLGWTPSTPEEWSFVRRLIDHDPRPAMARTDRPVLALFGADDRVVPVDASVTAYRTHVRTDLLEVAVLPGGDHRLQAGDPPRLVDGYLDRLTAFLRGHDQSVAPPIR